MSQIEAAVDAASTRVTGVKSSERTVDGFGHSLSMSLRFDTAEPATTDELDVITKAIWQSAPWEPTSISIVVGLVDSGEIPVDLRAAAEGLGIDFRPYGQGGVTLITMSERYGAWKKP